MIFELQMTYIEFFAHWTLFLPFQYFIKKFRAIIDSASSDTRQMSIAIRGYGYFSKVELFHLSNEVIG